MNRETRINVSEAFGKYLLVNEAEKFISECDLQSEQRSNMHLEAIY